MELIKASVDNIENLRNLCIQAYSLNFHNHWNDNGLNLYLEKEFNLKRLEQDLIDEHIEYFIIRLKDVSIGFAKVNHNSNLPNLPKAKGSELEKIYVLPTYKGRGIGKLVLKELTKIVKEREKQIFFLCVIDTNLAAISFYKNLGFKFHSKTKLDIPFFKEELKGMDRMFKEVTNETNL